MFVLYLYITVITHVCLPFTEFDLFLVETDTYGFPTGKMNESAWLAFVPYFAKVFNQEVSNNPYIIVEKFIRVQNDILRMGITGIQDGASNLSNSSLFESMNSNGILEFSVFKYWDCQNCSKNDEVTIGESLFAHRVGHYPDAAATRLFDSGAKKFLDGSPQGGTAAVAEAYCNDPTILAF